jgi:uncharacterized protein YdeI (YjbR/CyaY-like superfamily)
MQKQERETFYPKSQQQWRNWLEENHRLKQSIWLICYKKSSNQPSISWSDAVDEALCFGWIDSTVRSLDDEKFMRFFSKRKPNGTWSKVNKEKIKRLVDEGLMTQAGYEVIEVAKQNGSWTILDDVEELVIPHDLEEEFKIKPEAKDFFLNLSKSVKKSILQWLVLAKQQKTRKKRIGEIVECLHQKIKPNLLGVVKLG